MFKNRAISIFLLNISFLFLLSNYCIAQKTVEGHYCYTYGDNETLVEAKRLSYLYALRDAIEKSHILVTSETQVENFALIRDIVTNNASSYLTNIEVKDYSEKNRTICYRIIAIPKHITSLMSDEKAREEIMKGVRMTLPNYGELTDNELINFVHKKWYSAISKESFLIALYNKFVLKEKIK